MIKLLTYILLENILIFYHWNWPAQGTGTMPVVSAHFHSLFGFNCNYSVCLMLVCPGEYTGGMPSVQSAPPANIPLPLPDLSKPPPGFPPGPGFGPAPPPPQAPPPLMSLPLQPPKDTELMPSMPYYDLPAGLMAPLVKVCAD